MRPHHFLVPVAFAIYFGCFPSGGTCQTPNYNDTFPPQTDVDPDGGGSYGNDGSRVVIDDDGGRTFVADIAYSIPPGAVSTAIVVSAAPAANAPPVPNAVRVGTPYELTPEGQAFLKPVTIDVPFDPAKIPDGKSVDDIVVFTAPLGSTAYRPLTGTLVDSVHVRVEVNHFSIFVAAVPQ